MMPYWLLYAYRCCFWPCVPSRSYVTARLSPMSQWFMYSKYPVIGGLHNTRSQNCGRIHGHPLNLVSATVGRVKVYAFRNNPILRVLPPSYWYYHTLSGLATLLTCASRTLCCCLMSPKDSVIGLIAGPENSSLAYFSSRWGSLGGLRVHMRRLGI